jgi:hypothetical protein
VAACGARGALACGGFGFARNAATTFDVFYWFQVTNYGVLYVVFDSAPSGSNHIDGWDLFLHVQWLLPNYFVATFSDESWREQAEKLFDSVHHLIRTKRAPPFVLGEGKLGVRRKMGSKLASEQDESALIPNI